MVVDGSSIKKCGRRWDKVEERGMKGRITMLILSIYVVSLFGSQFLLASCDVKR